MVLKKSKAVLLTLGKVHRILLRQKYFSSHKEEGRTISNQRKYRALRCKEAPSQRYRQ
jgi:hypothetical protein